ncbi:MAG: class I SAM-dependent RNA methyltransferase, partial [Saprospiraceae bacterium]|nr:class I SAM-dependent RNA methyltransferase [Saprospiraceae bacterium]
AIHLEKKAFEKLEPPEVPGILVTNPPYDERLKVDEISAFYQNIGDRLKQTWPGWTAWLISSNMEAWKKFGLRPSRKTTLFNGPLECYFQKFDLYAGKKHS